MCMEIIEGSRIRFQIKISTAVLHGIFSGVFSFFQRIGDFLYLLGTKFCDRRQTQNCLLGIWFDDLRFKQRSINVYCFSSRGYFASVTIKIKDVSIDFLLLCYTIR